MRPLLLSVIVYTCLFLTQDNLPAQDGNNLPPPPPSKDRQARMLAFLSPADKAKFTAVHDKVLAENPDLKAEEEALMKQRPGPDASQEERQAFHEKRLAHDQKVRQAMLKKDPSLASIFDQIDKHMSQMKAQRENSPEGNPPPPPPPLSTSTNNAPAKGGGNPPPPPGGNQ